MGGRGGKSGVCISVSVLLLKVPSPSRHSFWAFRAVTPGPFLEMILVGDELWPVGCSLSMSTRTERSRNASWPHSASFWDFSLLPILKCWCHCQPYSLFTPHPPTIPFTPMASTTPYELSGSQIHVSSLDCSPPVTPDNWTKPIAHPKGTSQPTDPDSGSSPSPLPCPSLG